MYFRAQNKKNLKIAQAGRRIGFSKRRTGPWAGGPFRAYCYTRIEQNKLGNTHAAPQTHMTQTSNLIVTSKTNEHFEH